MPTLPREILPSDAWDQTLRDLVAAHGWSRVGVITGDAFEAATDFTARLSAGTGASVTRWSRGAGHGSMERVEQLVPQVRSFRPEVVVTGGGGSTHDTGKGVAALLALGGRLVDHCLEFHPPDDLRFTEVPGAKVPLVTVPSTLSGSEANGAAGFTSSGSKGKRVLSDPSLVPSAVVLDPSLAGSVPPDIFLGSVMNALNHCVEGMASRRHNALSEVLLPSALRALASVALDEDGRPTADSRRVALTASVVTGVGMAGTWLGIAHAIGHVLGAAYGVAHGACHAVVAGACVRFNAGAVPAAHASAADALGLPRTSDALADWLDERAASWGLPRRLGELGVREGDLEELAGWVWRDHDTYFNPRRPRDPGEIVGLLREAL